MNLEFENRELRRQLQKRDYEVEKLTDQLNDSQTKLTKLSLDFKAQLQQVREDFEKQLIFANKKDDLANLIKQNQLQGQEKRDIQQRYQEQINELNQKVKQTQEMNSKKQETLDQQEKKLKDQETQITSLRTQLLEMTSNFNGMVTKFENTDSQIRQLKKIIEQKEEKEEKMKVQIKDNQQSKIEVKKVSQDTQTEYSILEIQLQEQLILQLKQLNDYEVEVQMHKLKLNEKDGLIYAIKAHNRILQDKAQQLAFKIETMMQENVQLERLKDECYQICKDYIDKKKVITATNQALEVSLKSEKHMRKEMGRQIVEFKRTIEDLRSQITVLLDELDSEAKSRLALSSKKSTYKNKVHLANQRIRYLVNMIDDITIRVVGNLLNSESDRELQRLSDFEREIQQVQAKIQVKEEDIKSEVTFIQRYIDSF